jgi:hypothetical protein
MIELEPLAYRTRGLGRTKVALICKKTGNPWTCENNFRRSLMGSGSQAVTMSSSCDQAVVFRPMF